MRYNDQQIQTGVLSILKQQYGFKVSSLDFVPIGEESYSYVVVLDSGKKLFAKFCAEITVVKNIEKVNKLLLELRNLDFIVAPIVIDGKTTFSFRNGKVYTYPYVEGQVVNEPNDKFDKELTDQLTVIMSAIHSSTDNIKTDLIKEDFSFNFIKKYTKLINPTNEDKFNSVVWKLLQNNKDKILKLIKRYLEIGEKYKNNKPKLVLTHGDITGLNIIPSKDGLKLTDWDGACFAPKERDFIFLFDNPNFSLEKYYQLTGEKSYDQRLKEYYSLEWSLNSIIGNFENIINSNRSNQPQKEFIDEINEYLNYY